MADAKRKCLTIESRKRLHEEQNDHPESEFTRIFPVIARLAANIKAEEYHSAKHERGSIHFSTMYLEAFVSKYATKAECIISADRSWSQLTSDEKTLFASAEFDRAVTFAVVCNIDEEYQPIVPTTAPTPKRLYVDKRAVQAYGHLSSLQEAALKAERDWSALGPSEKEPWIRKHNILQDRYNKQARDMNTDRIKQKDMLKRNVNTHPHSSTELC